MERGEKAFASPHGHEGREADGNLGVVNGSRLGDERAQSGYKVRSSLRLNFVEAKRIKKRGEREDGSSAGREAMTAEKTRRPSSAGREARGGREKQRKSKHSEIEEIRTRNDGGQDGNESEEGV